MSLLGRLVLPYARCNVQSIIRKDASNFGILRPQQFRRQDVRGFRTKREMAEQKSVPKKNMPPILRYCVYTAVTVPSVFVGAMIWQYENMRQLSKRFKKIMESQRKTGGFRNYINALWNQYFPGQKMVIGIISANVVVFLCWRSPKLYRVLHKYFQCMPGNPASSMTLSAFSHHNFFHIFANMYVLWSFTPMALNIYGKEQFLAVYLSAATFSGLTSTIFKSFRGLKIPSVGASGAVIAILASVCYAHPDARLAVAFVEQLIPHSFSAKSALIGLVLFDTAGALFRWKLFDHVAHLGGVLFGLVYMHYGKEITWDRIRKRILRRYHNIRTKS